MAKYDIQLINVETKKEYNFKQVVDINYGEKLYYKFFVDTTEVDDGEYNMTITENGQLILAETLFVGDYQPYTLQYKRGENTFIDVVLDARLEEEKIVDVDKINMEILTGEDYDGIKKVVINAQKLYDNAFDNGYDNGNAIGYETGIKIQKELLETLTVTENGTYTKEDGYNTVNVNVQEVKKIPNGIKFKDSSYSGALPSSMWNDNDWSGVYDCYEIFSECKNITDLGIEDLRDVGLKPLYTTYFMFYNCRNLDKIPMIDTSEVVDMNRMFYNCKKIKTIPLLDTSKVKDMQFMFSGCDSLTTIPQLNTTNVVIMNEMFSSCKSLVTVPELDTPNVTEMYRMFAFCDNLTEVKSLNITNATQIAQCFNGCTKLYKVTLIGNPSKLTNISNMFNNCSALTLYYDDRFDYSNIIAQLPTGSVATPITVE